MKEWIEDILGFLKALFIGAIVSSTIVFVGFFCAVGVTYLIIKILNFLL